MAVSTSNIYGNISISDEAIARVASHAALDCYGIVELVSPKLKDTISELFNKSVKGIKVKTEGGKIYIKVFAIFKLGVSISAVAESLKESVKYQVEKFTGMLVYSVDVDVLGVKL